MVHQLYLIRSWQAVLAVVAAGHNADVPLTFKNENYSCRDQNPTDDPERLGSKAAAASVIGLAQTQMTHTQLQQLHMLQCSS